MALTKKRIVLWFALAFLSPCWLVALAEEPDTKPDLRQLRRLAERTRDAMQNGTSSWTMAFETGTNTEVDMKVYRSRKMARYDMTVPVGGQEHSLLSIVARDGAWFVAEGGNAGKFRPYEAPTSFPSTYFYLTRCAAKIVDADLLESKGTFVSSTTGVATFTVPLDDATRRRSRRC